MQCPRQCGVELRKATLPDLGDVEIHICPTCEGGWYPQGTLGSVGQTSISLLEGTTLSGSLVADKLEQVDLDAEVACPVCAQTMNRFAYTLAPDVKIDECLEHGTWLDDGELGTIVNAVAGANADMAAYRKQLEEKRKEMDLQGIANGGSSINPFALTIRLLNKLCGHKPG